MKLSRFYITLFGGLLSSAASAQSTLLQGGPITAGHVPIYVSGAANTPVVQDSGPASGGGPGVGLSELNITSRAANGVTSAPYANSGSGPDGTHECLYDAPTTNSTGYHYLCFDPNALGGGLLDYGSAGGASTLPLQFKVNGVTYTFPFSGGGGGGSGVTYNGSPVNSLVAGGNINMTLSGTALTISDPLAVQQSGSTVVGAATTLNFASGATVTANGNTANVTVSGGSASLWAPGAPNLSNWTPVNIGSGAGQVNATVVQNGTNAVTVSYPAGLSVFGGYEIAAPTPPYKIIIGISSVGIDSADGSNACTDWFGFGWTDGTKYLFSNNTEFCSTSGLSYFSSGFSSSGVDFGSYPLTANSPTTAPYVELVLTNDGTNVTFGVTEDGVTETVLYSSAISSLPLANLNDIFFAIGNITNLPTLGGNITLFLYDTNGLSRLPQAPGY